jgi:hypothetical protein
MRGEGADGPVVAEMPSNTGGAKRRDNPAEETGLNHQWEEPRIASRWSLPSGRLGTGSVSSDARTTLRPRAQVPASGARSHSVSRAKAPT